MAEHVSEVVPPTLETLGPVRPLWEAWLEELTATFGATHTEWKTVSKDAPPSLRVLKGKRTIVWLSPKEGCFQAAYAIGEKAVQTAPKKLTALLEAAPRYPEGRGVRIEVKSEAELPVLRLLTALKLSY